jgi:hypothetical protein
MTKPPHQAAPIRSVVDGTARTELIANRDPSLKTSGARALIGDVRSGFLGLGRQIVGGPSRTAGLGPCFWETFRGSGVWTTNRLHFSQTHAPRATANRPVPFKRGTVHAQGVKSWGGSFIWNGVLFGAAEPWIAYAAAVPKREVLCCRSADG